MSFPLQVATQDKVLAAQVRGVLNKGPEWNTTGSTLADATTSLADLAGGASAATIVTKVNIILSLLRNLNLPAEGS
jgi:hypothetical protein